MGILLMRGTAVASLLLAGVAAPGGEPPAGADAAAIARAGAALQAAADRVKRDPLRPVFHFRPPACWMNDPTGTIFYKGWFHLFYQLNPYGDAWGATGTCWGHARSRDLVHWEHLPVALHPRREAGERRCNSGSMTLDGASRPVLFYTSVPDDEKARPREQWAAVACDDDLVRWERVGGSPVIPAGADGGRHGSWGDPFVFRADGRTFVTGKASAAGIPVYEAQDASLTRWAYRGPLANFNGECPNFFPLGDRWVLLTSPHGQVRWYAGTFDRAALAFKPEQDGILDHGFGPKWPDKWSRGFYATTVTFDPQGRCLLWGWASGFPKGRGWNGCLALPRVLTLGPDGRVRQNPAPELEALRDRPVRVAGLTIDAATRLVEGAGGDALELKARFAPAGARAFGLRFRRSADGSRAVAIRCTDEGVDVAGTVIPVKARPLALHVFLDRTLLEVFLDDGREAVTRVVEADPGDAGVELFAEGGAVTVESLDVWRMKPVWDADSRPEDPSSPR
jgi:beta-fructofuranosidase